MKLRRPYKKGAEAPNHLILRLSKHWPKTVCDVLHAEFAKEDSKADPLFPIDVSIGQPAMDTQSLITNRVEIQEWIGLWKDYATSKSEQIGVSVEFKSLNKRTVGKITVPHTLTLDSMYDFCNLMPAWQSRGYNRARRILKEFVALDERLIDMLYYWETLTGLTKEELQGFLSFLHARLHDDVERMDIRELSIAGLHTKWIENNQDMVRRALTLIGKIETGATFREEFGFFEYDRQQIWMKFHPDDYNNPMGGEEIGLRPSKIQRYPDGVHTVIFVENKVTYNSHAPLKGVCLSFGAGNAASSIARAIPPLKGLRVLYWGDLDSYGMKILSGVREVLPQTRSVFMDSKTMRRHSHLWTKETGKEIFTSEIHGLTTYEQEALDIIRKGGNRLEQERLQLSLEDLSTALLCRAR